MKRFFAAASLLIVFCTCAVKAQGRFPQTAKRILTASEVNKMSYAKARYALNEIYARHGYTFRSKAITKEFRRYSWYKPTKGRTMAQVEAKLNYYERVNLKLLSQRKNSGSVPSYGNSTNNSSITASDNLSDSSSSVRRFGYRGMWTANHTLPGYSFEIKADGTAIFKSGDEVFVGIYIRRGNQLILTNHVGSDTRVIYFTPHDAGAKMQVKRLFNGGSPVEFIMYRQWSD